MISGIDYAKGNDESCTMTFVSPKYIKRLEEENEQLKEQYCERTDCAGRLGNSRKVERLKQENNILHRKVNKCIELLQIGVLLYNNGCSRKGLFEEIEDCLEILKDSDVDE